MISSVQNYFLKDYLQELEERKKFLKKFSYKKVPLLKALPRDHSFIVDGTAGLLQDTLWFLAHDLKVLAFEKNDLVYEQFKNLSLPNLTYKKGDSLFYLENNFISLFYLDPFFEKKKTALEKKDMQQLKVLSQEKISLEKLLSLKHHLRHIVIKRYKHLPPFLPYSPNFIYGKKVRFEHYFFP